MRRALFALLALLLLPPVGFGAGDVDLQAPEPVLQAEMLERVTRFVDWPAESESSPTFVIAVLGDDDVARELRNLARTRNFRGKKTEIRTVGSVREAVGSHVLWVASRDAKAIGRLVAEADLRGVLTAGNGEGLAAEGLVLDFFRSGDRVRIEVNERMARRQSLRLAAKLLGLAKLVEGGPA